MSELTFFDDAAGYEDTEPVLETPPHTGSGGNRGSARLAIERYHERKRLQETLRELTWSEDLSEENWITD